MGTRRKARELALQFLYQRELTGPQTGDISLLCEHFQADKKAMPYARELVAGIVEHWDEINGNIQQHAENWRLSRMSHVDRNILRITVYELLYKQEVPVSVAINEAIEIARRFSTDDAGPFINGILDAVRKSISRETPPDTESANDQGGQLSPGGEGIH